MVLWLALVAISLVDVLTTWRALRRADAYESNPLYGRRPSLRRLLLVKGAILALLGWLLWTTEIPLAIGAAVFIATAWVSWQNWRKWK